MRTLNGGWYLVAAIGVATLTTTVHAEDDDGHTDVHLAKGLVDQLAANPCPLLEEMFRITEGPNGSCAKLRRPNGLLLVSLMLKDGNERLGLIKVGQRCHGGIVAADLRPKKNPRWVSYVAITVVADDENTLLFSAQSTASTWSTGGYMVGCWTSTTFTR